MKHSIEFLKKAREVGATHYYVSDRSGIRLVKFSGEKTYVFMGNSFWLNFTVNGAKCRYDIKSIDYTPLDDYYADKQLDINATGISE